MAGVTSYTNQLGTNVVNFTYDPLGRKTTEVYPGITTNSFGYDGANHLLTLTDGNNHATSWTFDLYGRMLTKADATGTVILTNACDPDNRLTNRWTIAKTNTVFSYDPAGNLTAVQYPVSHAINYYYDLLNRMTNMVDATGSSTYSYTVAGQLAGEDGPWTDDAVNYTYSTATRLRTGLNLLQPNSSPWVQSYSYDSAGRLQSITSPAGSFGYGFDPVRQAMVNSLSLPNAAYITNSFDTVARLLGTVLKNSTNGVLNSHQYAYNLAGQRIYLTNTAGDYRNYIYDNAGQLTNVFGHESNGAGRVNEYLSYTYDPAGNLKTRYVFTTTETFNVNSLNELSSQFRSGSTFTVAGNTTSTATNVLLTPNGGFNYSITPNADNTWGVGVGLNNGTNNLVAVAQDALGRKDTNSVICYLPATNQFSYNGNGNLLSDGNRNFAYDDENQLTSVWVTNGWRSDFVYDGKMRRRIRREYTWFSSAWLQTNEVHYIYDRNLVIQERDANNVPTLSYTRGRDLSGGLQGAGGIGGLLAMSQGSGASLQHSFYHADGNGNITALVNGKQAIVARYLYHPFGNILSKVGPLADANLYRFSSKEIHPTSGLLYYGYRFYDPGLQRWINRDPIGKAGGMNLFSFVKNRPADHRDPFGLTNQPGDFGWDWYTADAPAGFVIPSSPAPASKATIGPITGPLYPVTQVSAPDPTRYDALLIPFGLAEYVDTPGGYAIAEQNAINLVTIPAQQLAINWALGNTASVLQQLGAAIRCSSAAGTTGGTVTLNLAEGEASLVLMKDGQMVAQQSVGSMLTHAEFAAQNGALVVDGSLAPGYWIGTVGKVNGQVVAMNSMTFYGNQLPNANATLALRSLFH